MTVFFTADTHFGDHRVLNISKRPFKTVIEMDAAMIELYGDVTSHEAGFASAAGCYDDFNATAD